MNPPPPPPQEEPTIADVHDNNDDDDDSDTSTSIEEENTENFCDNPTHEILADGILAIFKSTTDRLQERVQATRASQMELKAMLDSLSSKLHGIQMAQQTSPIFDEYVHKLISVKHKVTVIYNVLYTTQERLTRVYRIVDNETARRKVLLDSAQQPAAAATTAAGVSHSLADATL